MKVATIAIALISLTNTNAFSVPTTGSKLQSQSTSLNAIKLKDIVAPVATAFIGCTLFTQAATASPSSINTEYNQQSITTTSSSILLSETSLDFSLPSYDSLRSNSGGFGDGVETFSGPDPGRRENTLQQEAIQKAEIARKARVAEKNAEIKRRDAERKEEAAMKKAEGDRRVKELFAK